MMRRGAGLFSPFTRPASPARTFFPLSLAFTCLLVCGLVVGLCQSPLAADAPAPLPALPDTLTKPEVRDVVSRLSDQQVRELLLQQLDRVTVDAGAVANSNGIHDRFGMLRQRVHDLKASVFHLTTIGPFLKENLSRDGSTARLATLVGLLAAIFIAALAGEWLVRKRCLPFSRQLLPNDLVLTFRQKVSRLAGRALLDILSLVVFSLIAVGLFLAVYEDYEPARITFIAVLMTILCARLLHAGARFLFAPKVPVLRMLPMQDRVAKRLSLCLVLIAAAIAGEYFFTQSLLRLGFPEDAERVLAIFGIWLIILLISAMLWAERKLIAFAIGGNAAVDANRLAEKAYMAGIVYLILMGVIASVVKLATDQSILMPFLGTTAILFALPLIDWIGRLAIIAGVSRMVLDSRHGTDRGAADDELIGDYVKALHGNVRVILLVLVVLAFSSIWSLDLKGFAANQFGERLAGGLFEIVLTLILAAAVWSMIKCALHHYAQKADATGLAETDEVGGKGKSRLATLVPLFGNFLLITIAVIVALIILSAVGINIGPLIAGAGVVGLAIGFGAQTLVRDIISGVFFLLDDAFRVGEYIDVGGVMGSVERISLRSLQLRHQNGPLNTIPFGEIKHLTNYSRDWAIMKLELRVPFETDLERVRKIIKKVGQGLAEDPEYGPNFLQPLKSQGVNRMDDSAFIIRVKFMSKPGEQFILRREVFRRIQEAFANEGIQFARRRIIVDTSPSVPPGAAAALAAAAAGGIDDPQAKERRADALS